MENKNAKKYFTSQLLAWHSSENTRSLPWKNEQDPYRIWLSEIILQQTRALQGLPYYNSFISAYPDITALANAADEEVFRLWQGLGYYNRCKNMLATARYISSALGGKFPSTYLDILALKGIGPYTAAAIASFAFGLPNAVVDGNVIRVLSRYFGIQTPFDTTAGKAEFTAMADALLDLAHSAAYNQAIMDLGATVCTPRSPQCIQCPLQKKCIACHRDLTTLLPVRSKKIQVNTRYFHYIILEWDNSLWLHKRTGRDIWENLNEPQLIEELKPLSADELKHHPLLTPVMNSFKEMEYLGQSTQRLTHRIIEARFFKPLLNTLPVALPADGEWIPLSDLEKTAFPKTVLSFLKKFLYF